MARNNPEANRTWQYTPVIHTINTVRQDNLEFHVIQGCICHETLSNAKKKVLMQSKTQLSNLFPGKDFKPDYPLLSSLEAKLFSNNYYQLSFIISKESRSSPDHLANPGSKGESESGVRNQKLCFSLIQNEMSQKHKDLSTMSGT